MASYTPGQQPVSASSTPTQPYAYGQYNLPFTNMPPGSYYAATQYQAGVPQGYTWPYPYPYTPQQGQQRTMTVPPPSSVTFSPAPTKPAPTFTSYTPSYAKEPTATASATTARAPRKQQTNFKGLFARELKSLMYGFGDDRNPSSDTVNVMEEILMEYIIDVCSTAGAQAKRSRLTIEDLRRALSRSADANKLARMEELLFMQEDIKRARAVFEENDLSQQREL